MKGLTLALVLLASLFVAASGSVAPSATVKDCAPPCGPIPVIITILLDKSKDIKFDETNTFKTHGVVQFYFDIDQNGYAYDANREEWVVIKVNKQPAWINTTVDPWAFKVPLRPDQCPKCAGPEGDPQDGQQQYFYQHDINVTVKKLRDPTIDELKKATRSDGTYRDSISASSNENMAGSGVTGSAAGLMEGYGIKEMRFPSVDEAVNGTLAPGEKAGGLAPGPGFMLAVVAIAAAFVARRRD